MLTSVKAGPYTIRGISVGGIYTALMVPELHLAFDAGAPARSFAGAHTLLLSHGHADHAGALPAYLGLRALVGKRSPMRVIMPAEIVEPVTEMLATATKLQRYDLSIEAIGLVPDQECVLAGDLRVRAFKTYHPVPSLGYQIIRTVKKLRAEFRGLAGPDIARRKNAGEDLFDSVDRIEMAYATDTLVEVLDREPSLYRARVLVLECTFLDDKKPVATARAGCHIHLDELLERADHFENDHVVLMHFSQIYRPDDVRTILAERLPESLKRKVVALAPTSRHWPG